MKNEQILFILFLSLMLTFRIMAFENGDIRTSSGWLNGDNMEYKSILEMEQRFLSRGIEKNLRSRVCAEDAFAYKNENGVRNSNWEVKIGIKGSEILGLYGEYRLYPGFGIFLDYYFQPILGLPINNIEFCIERVSTYRMLDITLPTVIVGFRMQSPFPFLSNCIGIKCYYIIPCLYGYISLNLSSFVKIRIGTHIFPILSPEGRGGIFPSGEMIMSFWSKGWRIR